jgi:hypothetical protein
MPSGAIVVMRFRVSNMADHAEPDWDGIVRDVIESDTIMGVADDSLGEIVSIEKWDEGAPAQEGK